MLKRIFVCLVVASVCSTSGFAQSVVFDNLGGAAVNNAVGSDADAFVSGTNIDDFVLSAATLITGVEFSGLYQASPLGSDGVVDAATDNFTINIFSDAGGVADTENGPAASFNVGSDVNRVAGANGFDFTAAINFDADADTTYHLNIINNTEGDDDGFNQGVSTLADSTNAFSTFDTDGFSNLIQQSFATDFQLVGTVVPVDGPGPVVPEPTSATLLALGFAGLFVRRRR